MDMCRAITKGKFNPEVLSEMARGSMKSKTEEFKESVAGVHRHRQMIIDSMPDHVASLNDRIAPLRNCKAITCEIWRRIFFVRQGRGGADSNAI
jgi:hypothetical protein